MSYAAPVTAVFVVLPEDVAALTVHLVGRTDALLVLTVRRRGTHQGGLQVADRAERRRGPRPRSGTWRPIAMGYGEQGNMITETSEDFERSSARTAGSCGSVRRSDSAGV